MTISQNKNLFSLTVGITTCFGDSSILDTVESIRSSINVPTFRFIIISDRTYFQPEVKRKLKKYGVELIENKFEGSQIEKQKQILRLVTSELVILTQDDVLFDKKALSTVVKAFKKDQSLTMVSILNKPVSATSNFEKILNAGTDIANKTAMHWNGGDNYLSVVGRFMAFRTPFMKKKFRLLGSVATSDAYYYFENKRNKGTYKYLPQTFVEFKNPQNMKEHLRKSSRFQYSNQEMSNYFDDIEIDYEVPYSATGRALVEQLCKSPIETILYFGIFLYTRLLKLKSNVVLNPIWEIDLSTKKIKAIM